jgi:hypothetical protein
MRGAEDLLLVNGLGMFDMPWYRVKWMLETRK